MHMQAWDPYYFSPLWCLNEAKELFTGWDPDFFSHCSLLFSFFSIKYTFRFLFVISCFSRSYSLHSHKGKPFSAKPLLVFFAVFLFTFSVYFAENFVSQLNFVALVVKSQIVLSFRNLDYVHTE